MQDSTAFQLRDKIVDFLVSCGDPYASMRDNIFLELQTNVLLSLKDNLFVIKIRHGEIKYFACWWRLKGQTEIDMVLNHQRPSDTTEGQFIYIVEAASKNDDAIEMARHIKDKVGTWNGVFWDRHGKGLKIFPACKGEKR